MGVEHQGQSFGIPVVRHRQVGDEIHPVPRLDDNGLHLRQGVLGQIGPRIEELVDLLGGAMIGVVGQRILVGFVVDDPGLVCPVTAKTPKLPRKASFKTLKSASIAGSMIFHSAFRWFISTAWIVWVTSSTRISPMSHRGS